MSRSRRKPYIIIPKRSKYKGFLKRLYNKRLRRLQIDSNFSYKTYRKYNNSWDIKDYIFYSPDNPEAYRK